MSSFSTGEETSLNLMGSSLVTFLCKSVRHFLYKTTEQTESRYVLGGCDKTRSTFSDRTRM